MIVETTESPTWSTGPGIDRSGDFEFVIMIRAKGDPERSPRLSSRDPKSDTMALWRKRLLKDSPDEWAARVLAHLGDGTPRTFNRIAVEMIDKTADIVGGTPLEVGVWKLVDEGKIIHTMEAPILFRLPVLPVIDNTGTP